MNVSRHIKFCANIVISGMLLVSMLATGAPSDEAGKITFLLGKAFINGSQKAKVGSAIREGDVVETLGNGHVHIRFVDGGLVSVRPDSRLSIEHYRYDPVQPSNSIIKFDLNQGVMRSISGTGAKSARDKFRLNTPIAAIGVRGTDFVVKASDELVQAIVNEGAIVVAPFSNACNAGSVGPCHTNSVELNGGTQQLLELSNLYDSPRLIPLSAEFRTELGSSDTTNSSNSNQSSDTSSDEENADSDNEDSSNSDMSSDEESTASDDVADSSDSDVITDEQSVALSEDEVSNSLTQDEDTAIENTILFPQYYAHTIKSLTEAGVSESEAKSIIEDLNATDFSDPKNYDQYDATSQFAWGRYKPPVEVKYDSLVTFDTQAEVNRRYVTQLPSLVNGLPQTTLLYSSSKDLPIDSTLGIVSFNLSASQMNFYTHSGNVERMDVRNAALNVDFTRGEFETSLTLDSSLTSEIMLTTKGTVDSQTGVFNSDTNSDTESFTGATTHDGSSSAYMFYKEVENGTIEGATLWDR